jgi:thiamine biosynthesis lipoprotein
MKRSLNFEGIGTKWDIEFEDNQRIIHDKDIVKIVSEFEELYSRFKSTSLLSRLANKTGPFVVTKEFVDILRWYKEIYALTGGIFTPLIGQTLVQSGYDKDYSFKQTDFTRVPSFDDAVYTKADNEIEILIPVQFDFGGVGKGYLIDKLVKYFKEHGLDNFIINGGGDIYQSNDAGEPSIIGLENPTVADEVIGTFSIINKSICSSAGNRRKWNTYHHIINPLTFSSPQDILATWVVADTALIADTLSTCLFFVNPSVFENKYKFEYLIVDKNLKAFYSDAFKKSLFV